MEHLAVVSFDNDIIANKVLKMLEIFKSDGVEVLDSGLETISPDDPDYKFIIDARKRRESGEKTYSIDEVIKEFQ